VTGQVKWIYKAHAELEVSQFPYVQQHVYFFPFEQDRRNSSFVEVHTRGEQFRFGQPGAPDPIVFSSGRKMPSSLGFGRVDMLLKLDKQSATGEVLRLRSLGDRTLVLDLGQGVAAVRCL
jgi:hypothetical protein